MGRLRWFISSSLRTRLLIAFLFVGFVPLILLSFFNYRTTTEIATASAGAGLKSLADSQSLAVGDFLARQVDKMQALSLNQILRDGVETINNGYEGDEAQIRAEMQQLDLKWRSANDADPLIQSRLNSDMFEELRRYRDTFNDNLEVIVTDKYGGLAAATSRTPNYYQGDQDWWQAAYQDGQGRIHIDIDFAAFDEFKAVYGVVIVVPMYSDNQVIGLIRTTYRIKGLTDLLASGQLGETGRTQLLLPKGGKVSARGWEAKELPSDLLAQLESAESTEYIQMIYEGIPSLLSQARVTEISERSQVTGEKIISNLGWRVVVHQNQEESLASVRQQTFNTLLLAILTVGIVIVVAFITMQFLTRPITNLTAVARRITAGDLLAQAPVKSRDEISTLARAFNSMTAQLRQTLEGLEQQVADRTQRLEIVATLGERLNAILNLEQLLGEVVNQIKDNFGYYHAHIYLLDEKREKLVVAEGTGQAGAAMKADKHSIPLNAPTSLVARAARSGETVRVDNVRETADWLPNPLLPDTYSEIAVPIIVERQVVGVLDVQSDRIAGLDEGDANLLRSLANQVAVAMRNARLFNEVETALAEARAAQERYLEQAWDKTKIVAQQGEYHYTRPDAPALDEATLVEAKRQALAQDHPAIVPVNGTDSKPQSVVAPVTLHNILIGSLQLFPARADQLWTEDDLAIVQAVVDDLAQTAENLRLFEETRERAGREQTIREITDKLRGAPDLNTLVNTAARELGEYLGVPHLMLELGRETESSRQLPKPGLSGNGE
jgi:GAF domain-containing protein/HAMP domain-containing protein